MIEFVKSNSKIKTGNIIIVCLLLVIASLLVFKHNPKNVVTQINAKDGEISCVFMKHGDYLSYGCSIPERLVK